YLWAKTIGGTGVDGGSGVATDGAGNVYVTGYFSASTGGVDFGGGALNSAGSQDVFLVKYNSAGAWQWSRRFGSTGSDTGNAFGGRREPQLVEASWQQHDRGCGLRGSRG